MSREGFTTNLWEDVLIFINVDVKFAVSGKLLSLPLISYAANLVVLEDTGW
jgi:hypothetical protein